MDPKLLPLITCPRHAETTLKVEQIDRVVNGMIETAQLRCPQCGTTYLIVGGILDLIGWRWPTSAAHLVNELPLAAWAYERTWRPVALRLLSGEPFSLQREVALITRLVGVEREGLLIDVGCSNGLYARAMAQARQQLGGNGLVVGIDLSLAMLREAQQRSQRAGLTVSYIRASAQALPFAAGTVHGLVMGGTLNEIGDIPAALREWQRLLTPRGRGVIMSLTAADSAPARALQQILASGGLQFPTISELNHLFVSAGLHLRAQWQYGIVVFSVVQRIAEETAESAVDASAPGSDAG
ncbi:MAG: methyltransferase domain-containing protein [Chloroflexus sp.]